MFITRWCPNCNAKVDIELKFGDRDWETECECGETLALDLIVI